jgi:Mor family transcriptional regulator
MSDLMLKSLAIACGPRIAEKVEEAVVATVREHLPSIIEGVLREQYPGETLRLYISKRPGGMRRVRDEAIRAKYNGLNVKALSVEFGLSPRMIFKIVSGRK